MLLSRWSPRLRIHNVLSTRPPIAAARSSLSGVCLAFSRPPCTGTRGCLARCSGLVLCQSSAHKPYTQIRPPSPRIGSPHYTIDEVPVKHYWRIPQPSGRKPREGTLTFLPSSDHSHVVRVSGQATGVFSRHAPLYGHVPVDAPCLGKERMSRPWNATRTPISKDARNCQHQASLSQTAKRT